MFQEQIVNRNLGRFDMVGRWNFDPSKNRKIEEIVDSSLKENIVGFKQMESDIKFPKIQSYLID